MKKICIILTLALLALIFIGLCRRLLLGRTEADISHQKEADDLADGTVYTKASSLWPGTFWVTWNDDGCQKYRHLDLDRSGPNLQRFERIPVGTTLSFRREKYSLFKSWLIFSKREPETADYLAPVPQAKHDKTPAMKPAPTHIRLPQRDDRTSRSSPPSGGDFSYPN